MRTYLTLVLIICIFLVSPLFAKEIVTRADGSKIVIHEDGTWKPYVESAPPKPHIEKMTEKKKPVSGSCGSLVKEVRDKHTGSAIRESVDPFILHGSRKLGFMVRIINPARGKVNFDIKVTGTRTCVNKGSEINFVFNDKSTLKLKSDNEFNCKGDLSLFFGGGNRAQLNELATKKINYMKIITVNYNIKSVFSEETSDKFKQTLSCMLN